MKLWMAVICARLTEVAALQPTLTVAAVQSPLRSSATPAVQAADEALELIRQCAGERVRTGQPPVDLFVLPELAPVGYSDHSFDNYLDDKQVTREVEQKMAGAAREFNAYVAYGEIGGSGGGCERTIRHVVMDANGERVCAYDKIHLCDYGDCSETRFFSPGRDARSFDCRGFTVGIMICADIRNPHLAAQLIGPDHEVDLVIQPAAFSRDVSFRTWRSFREARAVEVGTRRHILEDTSAAAASAAIVVAWPISTSPQPPSPPPAPTSSYLPPLFCALVLFVLAGRQLCGSKFRRVELCGALGGRCSRARDAWMRSGGASG